jgi:transcriptional regulator with XRE-family HTH domain
MPLTKARPNLELKRHRAARGLSQARLAALIGCGQGDIAKLETGSKRTTADWAQRIAPHLGVKPQDLFPSSEAEGEMASGPPATDPDRLRIAMAAARRLANLHGAHGREDVITNLAAALYDALTERGIMFPDQPVLGEEEAMTLFEAILKRLWRPPPL